MDSMTIFKIILSIQKHGRSFHFFESSQFSFLIFYILSIKTFTSLGSVQFSHSVMSNSLWPHGLQHAGLPVHHQLPEFTQTHIHWVGDAIQSSHLLFSPSLPAFNLIKHQSLFKWVSSSHQVAKVLKLQLQHQSFQWRTLESLLQHHSSKASIPRHSAFFKVQLSHPYMTTGKTIALTRWTFVGKLTSLLFNMLSRLIITFLPRSKHLLISWLQSPSAVILEPRKIKSIIVSIVSPSICQEVMEPDAMILVFWKLSFKPTFSLSSFTFIKRLFSSSSLSAIRVVSSAYLRLLIFLSAILIPAYASSSPAFLMMYSA